MSDETFAYPNWVQVNPDWIQGTQDLAYPKHFDPLNLYHAEWSHGQQKTPTF